MGVRLVIFKYRQLLMKNSLGEIFPGRGNVESFIEVVFSGDCQVNACFRVLVEISISGLKKVLNTSMFCT